MRSILTQLLLFALLFGFFACSDDNEAGNIPACENPADYLFVEDSSYLKVEFEDGNFVEMADWKLETSTSASGRGFMVWRGDQSLGNPGKGLIQYNLQINSPGTYRFIWKSAVTIGDNGTEHNDTWLRFPDADDFYGEKGSGSIVYPKGTGKTPNPEGSSSDGWFKIYRSGNDLDFKWQSRTSDNDAHDIYIQFDSPGIYTMEASARSSGNAIDQFVLFQVGTYSVNEATNNEGLSQINCQ